MTIASKFGAQDLNGNPFNYQQVVAPVSSNNVVVNTNFTNRGGSDAKVRLAATSVPLVSQTVSSTQGLQPVPTNASVTSTTVPTTMVYTITSTTAGTNVLTTAVINVTATTVNTNIITCVNTSTLSVGEQVVFSANFGNLIAGTVYYVLSIPSLTTFTVSSTLGGTIYPLSTAAGSINVQEATTFLQINQPVIFTGGTSILGSTPNGQGFGNIITGLTYYVQSIPSATTLTVSSVPSGPAVTLFTATGTMTMGVQSNLPSTINLSSTTAGVVSNTIQALTISNTTTTTNLLTIASVAVTATAVGTNLITCASTATLSVGQPLVFTGTMFGGLVAGTVYYVLTINNSTTFTISSTFNGSVFVLSNGSGAISLQQATSNLSVGQPIVFYGTTFGNIVAATTYYVLTIPSTTTFTVSSIPNGVVYPLLTASGTMITGTAQLPATLQVSNTSATVVNGAISVSATAVTTNLITAASTVTLTIGQPVVFSSNLGGLVAGTTYYVLTIPSVTTFTVSLNPAGSVYPLSNASGSITVAPQTVLPITSSTGGISLNMNTYTCTNTTTGTNLITVSTTKGLLVGQEIIFTGTTFGGITASIKYYVLTINSSTTFTVSTYYNGPVVALSTASGTMTVTPTTSNLVPNQPVTFYGNTPAPQYISISNTTTTSNVLTTTSIAVTSTVAGSNVVTAADTSMLQPGMPVVFSGSIGNIVGGTIYYVLSVVSSTTFIITSSLASSTAFTQASASGSVNVQQATTSMIVNEPIVFSGTTYGGITINTTYYIQSIVSSTTFTVSTSAGGTAVALTTAAGTMFGIVTPPYYPLTISATTATTNILTTASVTVTATTITTNLITCASTATFTVGQPVVFGSNLGNLVAGTIYYIQSIPSANTFTVSSTLNGSQFALTTASGSITVQQTVGTLTIGQPIVFTGTGFGNIAAQTVYYVLTINSNTTFTMSTTPGGSAFVLATATGTLTSNPFLLGGNISGIGVLSSGTTYYLQAITSPTAIAVSATPGGAPIQLSTQYGYMTAVISPLTTGATNVLTSASVAVTATTLGTNVITCANTATFAVGQPVVFSGAVGGLLANTVYYILTIPSTTTFTVSSVLNGTQFALTTATATNITVQQSTSQLQLNQPIQFTSAVLPLTVSNTSASGNIITTSAIAVTNTTTSTNLITCTSTATLQVGMPVVFDGSLGNLVAGTVYYIISIPATTTFVVSTTFNGTAFALTTASGTLNVRQATSNLAVNQPIIFTGTTFGNIVANTIYYVQSVVSSTTFTISALVSGTAFTLTTASGTMTSTITTVGGIVSGTTYYVQSMPTLTTFVVSATMGGAPYLLTNATGLMNASVTLPIPQITISNSSATGNVYTTASVAVSATTITSNVITCTSTTTFTIGQPVVFSAALGGLLANTVYYITTIPSTTTFTVSTSLNGPVYPLTTASGSINVQQSTTNLVLNQPVYFLGTAFGNVTSYTTVYFIQSVPSLTTFTISTGYNGSQFVLTTTSGTMQMQFAPSQMYAVSNTTVTSNLITLYNMPVTSTNAGTNTITCNHTYWLQVGMPVVFNGTNGGLTSGVIYYVQSIVNATSFTVVQYLGGYQAVLTNWNGSMNVQQSTTTLQINQPVVFAGTTYGNIVSGTTYYVYSIPSASTFTVSASPLIAGGTQFALTTATGLMTYMPLSTNIITYNAVNTTPIAVSGTTYSTNLITCANTSIFAINQPVVFSGALGGLLANTTYYVLTINSPTTFTVSTTPGGVPVALSTVSGSINVQQSTSSYALGQPVMFTNAVFPVVIGATTVTTNYISTATINVTATTATTNLVTCASTSTLYINQPIIFSGTIGGLSGSTVYYVAGIVNTTQFTVSTSKNGAVIALTTDAQSVTIQQTTTGLVVNQPVVFSGTTFGNLVSGTTYYVQSIVNNTQFTVSATYNGSAFTLTTASGTATATFVGLSGTSLNTIYYIQNILSSTSFMLSTVHGMLTPMLLAPSSGSVNMSVINTVPNMPITNTTVTTNVLTLGAYTASATYATTTGNVGYTLTNVVTVNSTAGLVYGQPFQFTGTVFGGVVLSTTYYVLNVISTTQFTFSATYGGTQFTLTTATGTMSVQPVTTNLIVNQPIVFYGATFGNIVAGTTYYINTIVSTTTFTVTANQYSNTAFTLTTTSGLMTGYYGPIQAPLIYSTTATTNIFTTMGTTVTTTSYIGTNIIGCYNTYHMYVGMPIIFSANFSSLIANTVYYVQSIPYAYGFTVSTVPGGPVFQLAYGTGGSITAYQAITNLWLNQPVTFDSGVFGSVVYGNTVAGTTYYVQSLSSLYQFVVSSLPGGSAYTLATANSTSFASPMIFNAQMMNIPVTNVYTPQTYPITTTATNNALTMGQILVNPIPGMWTMAPNNNIPVIITSASGTTNIISCNTTASLSVGLPIVFSTSFAGLQGGTTYYVLNIINSTQFTVANSWGGQQVQLNSVTNIIPSVVSLTISQIIAKSSYTWSASTPSTNLVTLNNTAGLSAGMQIAFNATNGGITANTVYYVLSVVSLTQITISTTLNGGQVILSSWSGSNVAWAGNIITTTSNTNNLYIGLPVVFSGTSFLPSNMSVGTTYYVSEILSSTTYSVAQYAGGPSLYGLMGGATGTMTMTPALPVTNIGVTLQYSTANLTVGQPIIASGTTFGNIVANTTYYVQSVLSPTTFTVTATQYSSTQFTLTQQFGYMFMTPSTGVTANGNTGIQAMTPSTPVLMSGATITVTNTNGTLLTTTGNTGFLSVNQPVMFTGFTIGGIQPLTYYYVQSIPTFNTFTLSSTIGGSAISWQTTSNTMTMQIVPSVGTSLVPYNAYYVKAVQTPFTYSISSTQNGNTTTLTNASGTFITQSNIVTMAPGSSTSYLASNQMLTFTGYSIGNIETLPSTNLPFVVTNTTTSSNLITVSNTATLIAGQPVVFLGMTYGNLVAYQTYYVLNVTSNTQFTISSTVNGPAVTLSTATGACYMVPAYYVKAVISPTQFVLSNTPNGPITPLATGVATGGNVLLATGQPVMYDYIEYDALIAPYGVLERTGIILPPNTYLYASSNINQVSVIALGIQEAV